MFIITLTLIVGDDMPSLRDLLNSNVVEQYAELWENLAVLLGVKYYQIASISKENESHPNKSVACCTAVLREWLKICPSPTWGELEDSVKILSSRKPHDAIGMQDIVLLTPAEWHQCMYLNLDNKIINAQAWTWTFSSQLRRIYATDGSALCSVLNRM